MIWISLNKKKKKKKKTPIKKKWYEWLINFTPEPLAITVGGFKDKNECLFKKNTPKQTIYGKERNQKHKTLEIILY